MDGLLRQMFFEDTLTVLDVEESAAGHHYWLNIITDLTEEEELGWMWTFCVRDALRDDALSEDGKKAVPFTSAAIIYKAAIRSNTKRAAYVESHAIEGTRRGMFGDQFTENERKKLRGFLPRPKRTPRMHALTDPPRSAAAATVVAVSCAGCSNLHAVSDLAKGYCITCWSSWRQASIEDRLPPTKRTTPEPDPEPVQNK